LVRRAGRSRFGRRQERQPVLRRRARRRPERSGRGHGALGGTAHRDAQRR
jgi:hypothetical protein